jgi:steroid delta-isomerase-like uncharacterized protein
MTTTTTTEHVQRLITRYFEDVWNEGHVDLLDELLTPDYLNHSPGTPNPPGGPEGLKPIVRAMREAIPDLHYDILDMIVTADKAAVYLRVTGTQRGTLFGIPASGQPIDVRQMQIEWVKDGRIWQHWRITDELGLMRQIGAIRYQPGDQNCTRRLSCVWRGKFTWLAVLTTPKSAAVGFVDGPP